MYITQDIANRIKLTAKNQKIKMSDLLSYCGLNINAVSEFSKGKQLSCISFAKIADYLDCSVDYLLGRCDNPNVSLDTYINGNNNGIQAVKNGTVNITPNDEITKEISSLLSKLNFRQKTELMGLIYKFVDENK